MMPLSSGKTLVDRLSTTAAVLKPSRQGTWQVTIIGCARKYRHGPLSCPFNTKPDITTQPFLPRPLSCNLFVSVCHLSAEYIRLSNLISWQPT